jgi:hypothetical protein
MESNDITFNAYNKIFDITGNNIASIVINDGGNNYSST